MDANFYQQQASETAIYPREHGIVYCALGLAGEAGEVAGKVKKAIRDGRNWTEEEFTVNHLITLDELGDVLWYAAMLATELRASLNDVMQNNLDKLKSRATRNVIGGDGDNR